ncbi:Maf/Ham1 [Ceraceosorus guamensis]|uniref:Maf/Ham1 n=1 Tax=Ceraceosorus guamensis TaxID=1522189 RepID=A0A316VT82_9BASI|nr:Maf/Ham1 [Ceraceosorus guamensis]PWN38725.1 Maf/Ham1 [Ceraceosorus guamensis]
MGGSESAPVAGGDRQEAIAPNALNAPAFNRLAGKRIILASSSPRRLDILNTVGIRPEVVPSTFDENLDKGDFVGASILEYPAETSARKAIEVYERLLKENPADPPDLIVAADTVVVKGEEILEKPKDRLDHIRMLADLNDGECEVITGVTLIHPIIQAPGFKVRSISERTKVFFAANPAELLKAYVEDGEGADRAGGFAVQGKGALLVRAIEGDYNNVVGFPLFSFCAFLHELIETEELEFV